MLKLLRQSILEGMVFMIKLTLSRPKQPAHLIKLTNWLMQLYPTSYRFNSKWNLSN